MPPKLNDTYNITGAIPQEVTGMNFIAGPGFNTTDAELCPLSSIVLMHRAKPKLYEGSCVIDAG